MGHYSSKIVAGAALFVLLGFVGTKGVYAEGLSVSADKDACENGDKVTVTVDASAIEGETPPDIQVEFDANRLNFENCSVEYGGGGGGLVTFKDKQATVEFTTLSGGDATVNVTATAEDAAAPETASVTIAVNGEDTAAAMSSTSTATGVSEGSIDIGEGRVVQKVFADEYMPVLFHKDTTDYKGETVECASFDMGDMKVLYTSDAAGADGKFMIINAATGELEDFRMIQGIENRFVIVLSDCEGPIPEGYTKAVLEWNGQTLTAFMEEDVAAGSAQSIDGINPADFFLVYAMSSEGNKGWYRYDKNEGTYQRFINTSASAVEGEESESDEEGESSGTFLDDLIPKKVQSILLMVLAPLALALIITVIVLAIKLHDYAEDLDIFYEEYYGDGEDGYGEDDEDEDEEEPRRAAKPGAVTAASLAARSMAAEEDEDEEDGEDEEDETEEDEAAEEDAEADDDIRVEDINEAEEEEEDDVKPYRPLTRKERKELEREEKWRLKEEKKAAKRRAQGYEEATPMDWSSFEKESDPGADRPFKKSAPPKYMTESMEPLPEDDEDEQEVAEEQKPKKAPLPPRRKSVVPQDDEDAASAVLKEEEMREKQRRLFEQQQRIEEQRRIEAEQQEAARQKEQQQFIASRTEDMDLDEDFQFEFLEL